VRRFVDTVFAGDIHAKRALSLASATLGVMESASLAIHTIGQGLAQARGLKSKHAIKQVDRLLSNQGIDVGEYFGYWVPHVIGSRERILVAMDWTDFDADDQATLAIHLITGHGRATPLIWLTVRKSNLKGWRNAHEDRLLIRLRECVPESVSVTVTADRGFGDQKLFEFLTQELGFGYVIRIRGNIHVTSASGETRSAADWVGPGGRARTLRGAAITAKRYTVPTVVCVKAKAMKEPWCLVCSDPAAKANELVRDYAKRWTIETSFRDTKNLRFGMGLSSTRIGDPQRRDRLLLISAFAIMLLTLLGEAGERTGLDRWLKANTVKRRTHSLFRQGCMQYDLIPNMPERDLTPLMRSFHELLREHRAFTEMFAVV
jgi:hypothetical protein